MCTVATASGVEARLRRVAWMHGFVGVGVGGAGAQAAQVYGRRAEARRLWRVAQDCARECRAWRLRRGGVQAGGAWSVAAAA